MAGCQELSEKWGGYQMLVNISEQKPQLDAICGFKDVVTDHSTVEVLTYMDFKSDNIRYLNRLQEVSNKK
tara:strand:+ start:2735 stop:2944 length:210 start_codon:yes stop_codon:yes gene_type:complete